MLSWATKGVKFTGFDMSVTLDFTEQVMVTAQALDAVGNQVSFTAPPTFSLGNPALANLVPLAPTDPQPPAGQFSMWLVPIAGQTGSDSVSVSEDAVAGDATTTITGSGSYTTTAPIVVPPPDLATTIAVNFGTPVPQVPAAPAATAALRSVKK
jgi:hypothetical protein